MSVDELNGQQAAPDDNRADVQDGDLDAVSGGMGSPFYKACLNCGYSWKGKSRKCPKCGYEVRHGI